MPAERKDASSDLCAPADVEAALSLQQDRKVAAHAPSFSAIRQDQLSRSSIDYTIVESMKYGGEGATEELGRVSNSDKGYVEEDAHDAVSAMTGRHRKDQEAFTSATAARTTWTTSTWIVLHAFLKWVRTPLGFLITIYGLNVVAWGGMLFLLLCNASKPMCWSPIPSPGTEGHHSPAASLALSSRYPRYYNCNDINSPRRIWLEIDSQILNALFCVTGFGLIPWRFRDLWYLLRWRLTSEKRYGRERKLYGLRVLAGIYSSWYRLPGSHTLDASTHAVYERSLSSAGNQAPQASTKTSFNVEVGEVDTRLPIPQSKSAADPSTGVRAPPTATWKLDFFIWSQVLNTFFQVCLCIAMWGFSRYSRPSWTTGLFVALACLVAGAGGVIAFLEGKKVKKVEGVAAPQVQDVAEEVSKVTS